MTAAVRRCWCGRPINDDEQIECAEHDDPPPQPHTTGPAVMVQPSDPAEGCTEGTCGDQRTIQLHPHLGRRCSSHVTIPAGPFRADLAADMADMGRADAAFAYLGAWLESKIDSRFAAAARRLEPLTAARLTAGVSTADIVLDTSVFAS